MHSTYVFEAIVLHDDTIVSFSYDKSVKAFRVKVSKPVLLLRSIKMTHVNSGGCILPDNSIVIVGHDDSLKKKCVSRLVF
jgi:hypothetical protein